MTKPYSIRSLFTAVVAVALSACTGPNQSETPDTPEPVRLPDYREITTGSLPHSALGTIRRYSVKSATLNDDMIVDVWTPKGYDEASDTTYPAIYVHDGQNLFDPDFAFAGVAWEIDDKLQGLIDRAEAKAAIVVGIANRGSANLRANDYFPENALRHISDADRSRTKIFDTCRAGFHGNEHAAFVAGELKPLIDFLYHTGSETFVMGSSMGGLASLYLLCEYPDIFGGAASLSTHWTGSLDLNADYTMNDDPVCAAAILAYLEANLPSADNHRLYLDCGYAGWDAGYRKYETEARRIASERGYSEARGSLMTYDAQGAGHNEWYWQQRVEKPLKFLLEMEQ